VRVDPDTGSFLLTPPAPAIPDSARTELGEVSTAASAHSSSKDSHPNPGASTANKPLSEEAGGPVLTTERINSTMTVLSTFAAANPKRAEILKLMELDNAVPTLTLAKKSASRSLRAAESVTSDNEARTKHERRRHLEFERRSLKRKTEENMRGFDVALEDLRQDRHVISADLKLAELKLLVLYQEYMLLLTYEGRDAALQQKQQRCKREKGEILAVLSDCNVKLEAKSEDMAEWTDKAASVVAELGVLIPESNPYFEILSKIFKKKIKRSRKGAEDQDGDEEEEVEDDDDDEDLDEEEVDDNCPPGCDVALYEKVLDLREKRLDHEEFIAETQKAMDDLKKTIERLRQREKQIDKDSRQTEAEIQQFHLQKQTALNQIEIVVPLCISQIYAFTCSGKLSGPSDKELSEAEEFDLAKARAEMRKAEERALVSQMGLRTHVLFQTK